jgi:hypothetical protein
MYSDSISAPEGRQIDWAIEFALSLYTNPENAIGGPIKKDRTFLFGAYEGLRPGLANTLIATVPTVAAKQEILPARW